MFVCVCVCVCVCVLPGSVPREQRRVWFADGILPNGEATDSSKGPAANPNPTQPVAASQYSNKSSGANASEVTICFITFKLSKLFLNHLKYVVLQA